MTCGALCVCKLRQIASTLRKLERDLVNGERIALHILANATDKLTMSWN